MSHQVEQSTYQTELNRGTRNENSGGLPKLHRMISRSLVLDNPHAHVARYDGRGVSQIQTHCISNHKSSLSQKGAQETLREKEQQLLVRVVKRELPHRYKKVLQKKIKWLRGELPFLRKREDIMRTEQFYERKRQNIRMAEKILLAKPTPELTRCQTELFYQGQQNVLRLRRMGGGSVGIRAKTQPQKR